MDRADKLLIQAVDDRDNITLNNWELEFIESLCKKVKEDTPLSEKQRNALHRLAEKYRI